MTLYLYTAADPGQTRCRMGFTVRDGPDDYINVTVWGSQSYLDKLSSSFKIYDVGKLCSKSVHCLLHVLLSRLAGLPVNLCPVEITNCQVQAKQSEEIEERFKPWTPGYTSCCNIVYSDRRFIPGRDRLLQSITVKCVCENRSISYAFRPVNY